MGTPAIDYDALAKKYGAVSSVLSPHAEASAFLDKHGPVLNNSQRTATPNKSALAHPAGVVTGIDETTQLPIVRRQVPFDPSMAERSATGPNGEKIYLHKGKLVDASGSLLPEQNPHDDIGFVPTVAQESNANAGGIDYDALAKQFGAVKSEPAALPQIQPQIPGQMASGAYSQMKDRLQQAIQDAFTGFAKSSTYSDQPGMQPKGGAQKVGAGIEQGTEMMLLGGPLKAAAEELAARVAPHVGASLARFLPSAARIGAEALNTGGVAAAHGENPVGPALIGAGGAAVSEALPAVASGLKNAAVNQYKRALAPTTKINKAIAEDIAPQMIQRGITGNLESIESQAGKQAKALKPQVDAAYGAIPEAATAGSGKRVLDALEQMKGKYIVDGKVAQPAAVKAISDVQDIVKQYGDDISPKSLRKLKQIFDEPVAARGGFAGADLSTQYSIKAQKVAANEIRSIVHGASPDAAGLDKEISFWLDVKRVAGQSALRRTGQDGGLLKTFGPLATGLGAAAGLHGGPTQSLEGAILGATAAAVGHAMRTPQWRTASALFKDQLANALVGGKMGQAISLIERLGAASQAASQGRGTTGQKAIQVQ